MAKINWKELEKGYRPTDVTYIPQQAQEQRRGGLPGFLSGIVESFTKPVGKFVNQALVQASDVGNTARMLAAEQTGNNEAYRKAMRDAENTKTAYGSEGGLFNAGTITNEEESKKGEFTTGAKKIGGVTAQIASTLMPAGKGASIVAKAAPMAGAGALYGGGEALAEGRDQDVLENALTGGIAGGAVGGAGGVLSKVLGRGSKAGVNPTILDKLETTGQQMEARSGGFGVGAKMSGSTPLGLKDSKYYTSLLEREGVKSGNPIKRLDAVERKLADYGGQIDKHLEKANRPLTDIEKQSVASDYLAAIDNLPNLSPTIKKNATQLAENFVNQSSDLKSLVKFRRGLDRDAISYISNPDAATAANQQAAKTLRGVISERTNELVPDIKKPNSLYSELSDAKDFLIAGGKSVNNPSGGIVGRVIESGPVQTAESVLGKVLRKSAEKLQGTPAISPKSANSFLGKIVKEGGETGAYNKVKEGIESKIPTALTLGSTEQLINPGEPQDFTQEKLPNVSVPEQGLLASEQQNQFGAENIQKMIADDMAATGGKNFNKIMSLYKTFGEQSESKPLSQGQQERADLIKALGLTEESIAGGSINYGPVGSRLEGLKSFFNAGDPETLSFKNTISGLRGAITKARAGASLTAGELKLLEKYTPSETDSEQVIQSKLQSLRNLYGYEAPKGGTTLEDALANSQSQQSMIYQ